MQARPRTAIVTGASRGIGAGITRAFLDLGYNVVANALHFADSALAPNGKLALVEGNIGQLSTATRIAETAISRFGSIDAVVANAGIFFAKPFTEKGFFSLRPTKAGEEERAGGRKLMKPFGELNRGMRAGL